MIRFQVIGKIKEKEIRHNIHKMPICILSVLSKNPGQDYQNLSLIAYGKKALEINEAINIGGRIYLEGNINNYEMTIDLYRVINSNLKEKEIYQEVI
jgi:hypothetical protein